MAVLKSLKLKSKEFTFKSFGNCEAEKPAVIVFSRFPLPDETFPIASQKNVLESNLMKNFDNTQKAKEALVELIINNLIDNITASRIDYKRFFTECVSHIDNLEYDGNKIETVKDFLERIPEEAFYQITSELYSYAKAVDEFSIEEKKI